MEKKIQGLAGKDDWEEAKASEVADFLKDMGNQLFPYIAVKRGFRQGDAVRCFFFVF